MIPNRYRRLSQRKLFRQPCAYCACLCANCTNGLGRHCRNSYTGCMIQSY